MGVAVVSIPQVVFVCATLVATTLIAGCSTGGSSSGSTAADSRLFAVAVDSTAFFRYGPQQGKGPDTMLPRDTIVTILRPAFGYSKVELKDGQVGFVATMDIRHASADLIAAANSRPKPPRTTEQFGINSSNPSLQAPPEPLPEIFPEPTPIPSAESSE